MKKNFILITAVVLLLSSCTVKVDLTLQNDNSVDISFTGGAGAAFSKMILAATGSEESLDTSVLEQELSAAGFANLQISGKGISNLKILMKDKNCSSYIFSSGFVKVQNNDLIVNVDRKSLKAFYDSADEQTQMILDLFLAPVFNDEKMSENEYIEMLGTFYGAAAADEVKNSTIEFVLHSPKNGKTSFSYSLAQLLCSN